MTKRASALQVLSLAAFLTSCTKPAANVNEPPAEQILARVGSDFITVEDFQRAMERRPISENTAARTALLDEMIQFRALVQEAKARGYDHDPQMLMRFDRLLADRVRDEDKARDKASDVTPAEIEKFYHANEKTFAVPAKIRASMIFVEAPTGFSEEKRAERRGALEAARARAAETPFNILAGEVSYDQETKFRGGDMGYLVEGQTGQTEAEAPLYAAAFALREPGQISDIITTPKGFYLIKLTERQPATVRPIATVTGEIRARLQRERQSKAKVDFATALLANRKVEVNRDRLLAIPAVSARPSSETAEPPGVPSQ